MHRLTLTLGVTAGLALFLPGCETMSKPVKVDFAEVRQAPLPMVAAPRPANGSLFQAVSYRPAFEDPRARSIGDTITIQIVENVTASQVSKSTSNRTTSMDAGVSAAPLVSAMDIANLKVGAASNNDFSGKGGTESANTFAGTITATVVEVLANGHMVVTGEKQIGVNQNVDVLRFSGTVDPKTVQPGNVVSSNKVANARMESRGRGAQAEAQTVGLLTRFFLSFLPF
ncbi:MAG: flagellar basal body L-ring protein FlgH [Burkholderiales bacterium]|nr:flagellar basal body L-ring protein FlgH [Burkholderiales bacterium]